MTYKIHSVKNVAVTFGSDDVQEYLKDNPQIAEILEQFPEHVIRKSVTHWILERNGYKVVRILYEGYYVVAEVLA